jgi:hypothetical protein
MANDNQDALTTGVLFLGSGAAGYAVGRWIVARWLDNREAPTMPTSATTPVAPPLALPPATHFPPSAPPATAPSALPATAPSAPSAPRTPTAPRTPAAPKPAPTVQPQVQPQSSTHHASEPRGPMTSPSRVAPGPVTSPSQVAPGPVTSPSQVAPGPVTSPSQVAPGPVTSPSQIAPGPATSPSQVAPGPVTSPSQVAPGPVTSPSQVAPGPVTSPSQMDGRPVAATSRRFDPVFDRYRGSIPIEYLRALVERESGTNPDTRTGEARGLMQIVPVVLDDYNKRHGTIYQPDHLSDPTINVAIGCELLSLILDSYRRNHPHVPNLQADWTNPRFIELLTFGWNAGFSEAGGVGRVVGYLERRGITDVTIELVHRTASAAGASSHLSSTAKVRWCKSVAALYQRERPHSPITTS